jgi:hypothetical protein
MTARAISRFSYPLGFALAVAAVYTCSILIAGSLPRFEDADLMALGVSLDLVLAVPALYYFLLVRGRGWPLVGIVPVFIVSVLSASRILPADRQPLISLLEWVLVPLELGLVGFIGWKAFSSVRRIRGRLKDESSDAYAAIRSAASEISDSPLLAGVLAQEVSTIYYALFSWRAPLPPQEHGFTSYRDNHFGIFVAAISMVVVIETVGVHVLLHVLWSPVAAWVLSALSLYGLVWLIADYRALKLRPTRVTASGLELRLGSRWEVDIPWAALSAVETIDSGRPDVDADRSTKPLDLVLLGQPGVELSLSRPVTVVGPFGLRRETTRIRLQIDRAQRFVELLEATRFSARAR